VGASAASFALSPTCLEEHNQQSLPFTWTAYPDKIIAAVRRGRQMLDSIH